MIYNTLLRKLKFEQHDPQTRGEQIVYLTFTILYFFADIYYLKK